MSLWVNLKRNKTWVDVYYKGEKICSVKVDEKNVGVRSCIALDAHPDASVKIVKTYQDDEATEKDESFYNKENFNR